MARLRLTEKADKEIDKLDRSVKGAMWDFMRKFRQDPANPGLRFKQLKGDSRLYSARVTDDYRALMLHVKDDEYMLVTVKHRRESYDNPDRYAYQINQVTGGIDFYDMASVAETVPAAPEPTKPVGLFARYSDAQLIELGVGRPLLSTIAKITTESQLLELTECVPRLTADVLFALHDGASVEEVMDQVTAPVAAAEPVDPTDYATAADRPASLVTTDDETLQAILQGGFERWQVYLHPVQRRVVERSYSGPARVGGGPGTGKTIVALHRVKWLIQRLPAGSPGSSGKDVLLTTFNKNLAADLRQRLLLLGGPELLDRVDVVNVDKLAMQVVSETQPGTRLHWMDDDKAIELWREVLLGLGSSRWDAEFLNDEWSQIVLGHAITARQEYFQARRAGRGRKLNRAQRAEIWELVEQFTKRLDEQNLWTSRRIAAHAARLERELAATRAPRYRHIVVDEAQDLSSAHWMLLRAMVGRGPNDLFLAGDTHQRIYDNYVSLGSLGIEIRGRSSRLTLTYRSTHEILTTASRILGTEAWDDMDDGTDSLDGYRSVLRGPQPEFCAYGSWQEELDGVLRQVREWTDGDASIAVAVPTKKQVEQVESYLTAQGVPAGSIGPDGPRMPDGVHVGTLQRFKGLEYQRMILAGITDSAIPGQYVSAQPGASDPARQHRELMRARSLLFVAATRARDALVISWHGQPSRFLSRCHEGRSRPI
ncbi:MAG: UvrD-helicase domain-containing protein [Streptosporangiaceae bacterium]|nr:UvrD-helicase domain-containing protein [Streptosporangiaceae bacterium]